MRCRCRQCAHRLPPTHARVSCPRPPTSVRHTTNHDAGRADMLGLPADAITVSLAIDAARNRRSAGGSWMPPRCRMGSRPPTTRSKGTFAAWQSGYSTSPISGCRDDEVAACGRQAPCARRMLARGPCRLCMRCGNARGRTRRRNPRDSRLTVHTCTIRTRRFFADGSRVTKILGHIRVNRVGNAVAAGRILNTKTRPARIWAAGWGIGMELPRRRWSITTFADQI